MVKTILKFKLKKPENDIYHVENQTGHHLTHTVSVPRQNRVIGRKSVYGIPNDYAISEESNHGPYLNIYDAMGFEEEAGVFEEEGYSENKMPNSHIFVQKDIYFMSKTSASYI